LQGRVAVASGDTEAVLSARVQRIEHMIYPQAVEWLATGKITMHAGKAYMNGAPLEHAPIVDLAE
jgi:phosphoribosylglycinamide formyltransferase-1